VNSIMELAPYRTANGGWAFDDARVGLVREAFVSGADTLLSRLARPEQESVRLLFSASQFPEARQLLRVGAQYGGTVYCDVQTKLVLWLCPALFHYFPTAPAELWVAVE
jgi:multidrug efflux pump subunit AcrA (membrane-fusion protein)